MIWLAWRQFRGQFVVACGLLAAAAAYLLYVGSEVRAAYRTDILRCVAADGCNPADARQQFVHAQMELVTLPTIVLLALPAIVGIFWGAPLISREFETSTHRLVWNQSVSRTRWLAVKLGVVAAATVAATGALSLLLTSAASRYDQVLGNRFDPLSFAARNVAPLGYALFAFVLGTTVGLFARRTVAAMAVTLLAVGVVQLLLPMAVRPHLRPPVTASVPYDPAALARGGKLALAQEGPVFVRGYIIPGALMLDTDGQLLDASGQQVYSEDLQDCLTDGLAEPAGPNPVSTCATGHDVHFVVSFQPAGRYWSFQWLETGVFVALSALLAGLAFWRIRRVRG
jgi:hypothetical protein